MSRRTRRIAFVLGVVASLFVILAIAGILTVRSQWFRNQVRGRIVTEVEKATGGRAEIGAFDFNWKQMRAEVDGFVVHGTEPAGAPPLFRADAVVLGIKIVSLMKRAVDLQYLDVRRPQIYVILYPDGRTNIPAPKISKPGEGTIESILDLAIGRFGLLNGSFEVSGRGKIPFDAQGNNLRAQFDYDRKGPRYQGSFAISPARIAWGGHQPLPFDLNLALAVSRNLVSISSGRLATAKSQVDFSGALDSLADFSGAFQYKVRASLGELDRALDLHIDLDGPLNLVGKASFHGASNYQSTGTLHATAVRLKPDPNFALRDMRVDGAYNFDPRRTVVTGFRLGGEALATLTGGHPLQPFPVSGRMESIVLRGRLLEATGIHLDTVGGVFDGKTQVADLKHVRVEGDVTGFDVRETMRIYDGQPLPWDAAASGPLQLSVTLGNSSTLVLSGHMAVTPTGSGAPVHGSITAAYDGQAETLDLFTSTLSLPSTRLDFSGILGRQMRVHADSHNLDEILPAFEVSSIPLKLVNGEAVFDGAVTGKLADPRILGHTTATNVVWSGRTFQSLQGDVDVSSMGISVRNGALQQGALHAQGAGSLSLRDWSAETDSPVSFTGAIRNAPAAELMAIANVRNLPLEGTVTIDGKVAGTYASPSIAATVTAVKGSLGGEPFDRFSGSIDYAGSSVDLAHGQLSAGRRSLGLQAHYQHQAGDFAIGQLRFEVNSNALPLAQFRLVSQEYPGIGGTAELHAAGTIDLTAAQPGFRLIALNGTLAGKGLRINDQQVRDATLTVTTKNSELAAHFDSEVAGSVIEGDGKWALAADYPGSAQVSFKRLDLERLRGWLRGRQAPGGMQIAGSAEGALTISGPAIKPDLWKAQLRIPSLQIGPGPDLTASSLALHNPNPIVVNMEHNIVKVESARLVGRATDLSLSGTVNLQQKSALDLRVNGRFDLASLKDFNDDIYGSGFIETGVTIRGAFSQPQVAGRLELKDATLNLAELPVVVAKTNGLILFDGSRATIQSLSGESGGGKVDITGFAGYAGDSLVFRLHANAHEVRVRYPEDFSTIANASLSLTGTSDSSTLAGHITVLRTGFNPHSDFSSVLAKSAEPVRTPSAETGLLANMRFDVEIDSAPDITFQSSLAQGLQAEASLRVRGTASNPSLLGRINITGGQIVFFGTPFTVNQGSIAFYNPVKIEPVLNLDLDTKARGIDVILNIAGPINKLNLTPRSDPPMPFADIVALLATGVSPTSNAATLMSGPASPQSLQQMGASALLGEALASPVTGRLQRFFGVTRLKIDPTLTGLTGVENNPQARLTIEQQVTPEITFTYITDVTSTNPLVIQVEWAFSRKWSAVALREENGLVGLNFVYKRSFK